MIRGDSTDHVSGRIRSQRTASASSFSAGVDNTVKDNQVAASVLAGIRINIFATGNVIVKNAVTSNPAGIEFLVSRNAVGCRKHRRPEHARVEHLRPERTSAGGNTVDRRTSFKGERRGQLPVARANRGGDNARARVPGPRRQAGVLPSAFGP